MFSDPTYQMRARTSENPTHGSGWIVQIQPTRRVILKSLSAVERSDLNNPPISVGWDSQISKASVCRPDLK